MEADGLELAVDPLVRFARPDGLFIDHLAQDDVRARPGEGGAAGHECEEGRPQTVDVGGGADVVLSAGLLGRHVFRGPQRPACQGCVIRGLE